MAGPYASLTSPYAPDHLGTALQISDLIARQGQGAAAAKYAKRMMVGDLIGGIGGAVGNIFGARDDAKKTAAENAQIAEMIASGQPVDLAKLVATFGVPRAKEIYTFVEAAMAKQKAASQEANNLGMRQRSADALRQGADPAKVNIDLYGEGAPPLPPSMMPDAKAVEAAAAKKKLDEENALLTEIATAMQHGMTELQAQQYYATKTGGKVLPPQFLRATPEPKPDLTTVRVPGPGGSVVTQGFTPAQLQAGVTTYQEPKTGGDSEAGWSIKEVVDLATGQPRMIRVNSRSGEVRPITLPGGLQSTGGAAGAKLTGAQQDDLTTMETVLGLSSLASEIGEKNGWKGVGAAWSGTASSFLANLGWGAEDEELLRNYLGNVQGTIAKLRGGTAFSAAEKKMLDSYTPGIDDGDSVIKTKLKSLAQFIELKRAATLKYAGGGAGTVPGAETTPAEVRTRLLGNDPATGKPYPDGIITMNNGRKFRKLNGVITEVK